ncbi:MAG: glutathione S-transferase family protein [Proteobacteria bacterium]|nr:glutathione S-transferase family protein [Pseudomonadota bacterium]
MYTLYYTTRSYTTEATSLIPRIALEETGAEYDVVEVELMPSPPDWYLSHNPHGKLPSLVDRRPGAGETIVFPSAAILCHLADAHPEAHLLPPPGTPERALCYRSLFDMAEMLNSSYMMNSYPERFSTDPGHAAQIAHKGAQWIVHYLGQINEALRSGPYLAGSDYSICDIYMYVMARWYVYSLDGWDYEEAKPFEQFEQLVSSCQSIEARPAVERALAADEINFIARS